MTNFIINNVFLLFRKDPFSSNLLPTNVPELYDGLPDDDRENIVTEEEEETADEHLTPEMVNAQFALIDQSVVINSEEKTVKKE